MNIQSDAGGRKRRRHTREALVSGIFYPPSAHELSEKITALLGGDELPKGHCSAIISPHGSLDYSGAIAAKAWKAAAGREIGTIVIVCPSHRNFEPGMFLPEAYLFSVPVGAFKVDRSLVRELLHCTTALQSSDIPHFEEHGIEMQLIFAARYFPDALILPVIVCGADDQALDSLFANLQFALGDRVASTLFVLTSNLAVSDDADECLERSAAFVECIEKGETEKLSVYCDSAPSFCGGRMILSYLRSELASGMRAVVLGLGSSAGLAEQGEPIVGYAAVGFSR